MQRKLLIIIDEMERGGSQKQILDTARHIDSSVFSVSVVYFRKHSSYVDELRQLGVEVTHIPKRRRVDIPFFIQLCSYLRKNRFDLVHAFSFSGEMWGWLANLFSGNARFVSTVHSVYEWYSPLQWMIKRWVTQGSAALVANSQAGADYAALRMGIRRNTVDVVPNGIELPARVEQAQESEADDEKESTPRTPRMLFVGRLVDHKNLPCLLRAFSLVARQHEQVELDLVGDGPLRQSLEQQVKALGIGGRVNFWGEQNDVTPWLRNADLFVISSHREGLSNAVMEAMSVGLPVLASNVGGNPELVTHEKTGMLFPADDHETLASMALELLHDEQKRRTLAAGALAAARRFHDPARMVSDMERIYERCLVEETAFVFRR